MSEYELELIKIIRQHDDPTKAMMVAIEVITDYLIKLKKSEASATPQADAP